MTDLDVVVKAAEILGGYKVIQQKKDSRGGKQLYRLCIYGQQALYWMEEIKSFMGERRTTKIEEILEASKTRPKSPYPQRKSYSRGAIIAWSKETNE
jgi:hypothetical protein